MARVYHRRAVEKRDVIGGTTGQGLGSTSQSFQVTQGWAGGDEGLVEVGFRFQGELNFSSGNGTSVVTDGVLNLIRSLTLRTDMHGPLIDRIDGLGLHRIQSFQQGTRPALSAPANANDGATFSAFLRLPLIDSKMTRPYDTLLDLKHANPRLEYTLGAQTDVVTGGTGAELINVKHQVSQLVLPGPLKTQGEESELPSWMYNLEMQTHAIDATKTWNIDLPFRDRTIKRIYISQRNISDRSELATVVTASQKLSLKLNGTRVIEDMSWGELQDENKSHFGLETMPTGWVVLEEDKTKRIMDALWVLTDDSGKLTLEVEGTSVTNGGLWIYVESWKPLPEKAQRQAAKA